MRTFKTTRGLGACGREQPCGVEQPCGIKEPCLILDADFQKNMGVGRVWSGAALWSRAALWNKGAMSNKWAMGNTGCGHLFPKQNRVVLKLKFKNGTTQNMMVETIQKNGNFGPTIFEGFCAKRLIRI